ncbi:MAG: DEAD/DEAH box helicase [Burkholderiales bacterium]
MQFSDLGLAPELLQAIADQGYTEPTPIQAKAIPPILLGRDIMAAAQTGTGKTAGFTLPMLQRLKGYASTSVSPARHPIRALILAPTRELAAQVHESVKTYSKYVPIRSTAIYGGVPMDPQLADLRAGVEILVATPGRLLDHIQSKVVMFHAVEFLVLDEADRMLDMGFLPDIKRIISLLPAKRQSLLFSATYSEEIRKLAAQWLRDPVTVEVAARNAVTEMVTHTVYEVDHADKRDLLTELIRSRDMRQVLVFCNTKIGANRLAYKMQKDGVAAAAIHSDRTQAERMLALAEFKEGKMQVLVATDIAARGLDIEELPFVVNFDLPISPEDYVHRIGRTGRAGSSGEAISLMSHDERDRLGAIERLIKIQLEVKKAAGVQRVRAPRENAPRERGPREERGRSRGRDAGSRKPSQPPRHSAGRAVSSDPLFSQPYQPSTPDAASATDVQANAPSALTQPAANMEGHKRNKNPSQVAALFRPPVKEDA